MVIVPSSTSLNTDNDGISDSMELALGSDPNLSSSTAMPAINQSLQSNTPNFSLVRPKSQPNGLNFVFEWSKDLETWSNGSGVLSTPTTTSIDGTTERISVDSMFDLEQKSKQFFRLRVEQQHLNETP